MEATGLGHEASKGHITALTATASVEGRTAAKPVVAVSSHATSGETESDGNRGITASLSSSDSSNIASMDARASAAAPVHSVAAEQSWMIDSAGAAVGHGDSASLQGAASEHGNDQPQLASADPGTLQSLESPSQTAAPAVAEIPLTTAAVEMPLATTVGDSSAGAAAPIQSVAEEQSSTIGTASAAIGQSDAAGLEGAASEHGNDQPHLSAHAAADIPLAAAVDDANASAAAHGHGAAAEHSSAMDASAAAVGHGDSARLEGAASEHGNDQPHLSPHAAADIPLAAAVDDTNPAAAAHTHGAAAEHSSAMDASGAAVGHGDAASLEGAASEHGNDQPHLSAHAAADMPLAAAVDDANASAAAHGHGAAAEHSPAIETVGAAVGQGDTASPPAAASTSELPSQAAVHAAVEIPPAATDSSAISVPNNFNSAAPPIAVGGANGNAAAPVHAAAAEHASAIDTVGTAVAHGDAASLQGAASGDVNDQFHFAYTNPESPDLPNQAALPAAGEIPAAATDTSAASLSSNFDPAAPPTAVEDANGSAAAHTHGAAAEHSPTIDTAGAPLAQSDSASLQGAAPGDMNDQFHFAYTDPGTLQSLDLSSQAASPAAGEISPATTDHSAVSLSSNLNSAAAPAGADNPAPQAVGDPSLLGNTVSGDSAITTNGLVHGNDNDLFQVLDDILTQAAQAPLDTVATPDQNHDVASPNPQHDNPSNYFIIHA